MRTGICTVLPSLSSTSPPSLSQSTAAASVVRCAWSAGETGTMSPAPLTRPSRVPSSWRQQVPPSLHANQRWRSLPASDQRRSSVLPSHSRRTPSRDAEARVAPSGATASALGAPAGAVDCASGRGPASSQRLRVPSDEAAAIRPPRAATSATTPLGSSLRRLLSSLPRGTSHTSIVRSCAPVMRCFPSGVKATEVTGARWLRSTPALLPVAGLHRRTVWSSDADTSSAPSGLTPRARTGPP